MNSLHSLRITIIRRFSEVLEWFYNFCFARVSKYSECCAYKTYNVYIQRKYNGYEWMAVEIGSFLYVWIMTINFY